jgi:hypothetical protein
MPVSCVTTSKNGLDMSICEFAGKKLMAQSRHGSEFALCRQLVALGCPDGELIVIDATGKELMRFASIHQGAGLTIKEGQEGERLAEFTGDLIPKRQEREQQPKAGEIATERLRPAASEPVLVSARAA